MSIFRHFKRFSPASLARGLWGRGPIPTRYKLLFAGQGLIFTMAAFIRTKDVEKAQQSKKLREAEAGGGQSTAEGAEGGGVAGDGSSGGKEARPPHR